MTQDHRANGKPEEAHRQPSSQRTQLLLKLAETLLTDSVEASRDFCAVMTQTSIAALGAYLALVAFVLPNSLAFSWILNVVLPTLTVVAFGVGLVCFIFGAWPTQVKLTRSDEVSLEWLLEEDYNRLMGRRRAMTWAGVVSFGIGLALSIGLLAVVNYAIILRLLPTPTS
jgi:hypothetical protein